MPQPQATYADGRPIPEADLQRALDAGEAGYEPGVKINVVGPAGETWAVPAEKLGEALAGGFQVEAKGSAEERETRFTETNKQYADLVNPIELYKGYHEALNRGATFGLSDPVQAALGGDPEGMRRRAANPATILPEVGGAVGSSLFLPGSPAALAGKVGAAGERLGARALGTGVVGRTVGRVLGGAGEGALYGAGSEVSRATLEQRPLSAEKLALSGLHGAVLGSAGGVVLGSAADGLNGLVGAIGRGQTVRGIANNLEESATLRALGTTPSQAGKLKDPRAFAQTLINYRLKSNGEPIIQRLNKTDAALPRLRQAVDEVMADVRTLESRASARMLAEGTVPDARSIWAKLKAAAEKGRSMTPDGRRAAESALEQFPNISKRIELEEVTAKLGEIKGSAKTAAQIKQLSPEYQKLKGQFDSLVAEGYNKPLSIDEMQALRREVDGILRTEGSPPTLRAGPLRAANNALRKEVGDLAEIALAKEGIDPGVWRKTNETAGHLLDAQNIVDKAVSRKGGKSNISDADIAFNLIGMISSFATGSILPVFAGAAATGVKRLIKEYGPSTMVATARAIQKMDRRTSALANSLVTGTGLKELTKAGARRATRIAPVATMSQAERFETNSTQANKERYITVTRSLMALQDPKARMDHIGAAIAPVAQDNEELGLELAMNLNQSIDALSAMWPTPLQEFSLQPELDVERLDDSEMERALAAVDILEDPVDAIAASMSGDLDPGAIEMLKALKPLYFQELRKDVTLALADQTKRVDYETGLRLALDFDLPEPSLEPQYLAETQQTFAQRDMMAQEQPSNGSRPVKAPKDMALPTQELGLS